MPRTGGRDAPHSNLVQEAFPPDAGIDVTRLQVWQLHEADQQLLTY